MAPRGLLSPLSSLRFEEKLTFSASQHLSFARSKWFTLPETESRSDVWSIKPPDFSIRLYRSVAEPREKERKTRSDPAVPPPAEKKRRSATFLPKVLHESYQKKDPPEFITSYRPPDALRSELMFVKTGKFPTGPYTNPKPHNFRPLDEDLPDMVTTYERDPGNMNLKLRNMDIIRTTKSSQTLAQGTPDQRWTPSNLQSPNGMRGSSSLSRSGLQNQPPIPDTDGEEERTAHSWTGWRRNSQDRGKIDHDS